jgi:hypothetical protein
MPLTSSFGTYHQKHAWDTTSLASSIISSPLLSWWTLDAMFSFIAPGVKSPLTGRWRDPKNRLWRAKIGDDEWTTDYKVAIPLQKNPTVKLTTPPTKHAYSLYECSTMHKLTHF